MKWIGGVVLLIVTIILLILSMFMFPWFSTKTEYNREIINERNPEYWSEKTEGVERDWDESTFFLQEYEMKSSTNIDWKRDNTSSSPNSGRIEYNSPIKSGGWEGSFSEMDEEGYPVPGFLPGGKEQLSVYNNTYYMIMLSMILAIITIVFVIISGLGKMSHMVPKVVGIITIVFIIIATLYFAIALPYAIETDDEELWRVKDPLHLIDHDTPPEAGGAIMGEANEKSDSGDPLSFIQWSPGLGWWLVVGAIITSMLTMLFMPVKEAPPERTPGELRRKYHEFDKPERRDERGAYDQEYIPPPRRRGYDDYYEGERYDYPPPRRRRPPPPPSYEGYDYGRPPPRPPQRRRRPPAGY